MEPSEVIIEWRKYSSSVTLKDWKRKELADKQTRRSTKLFFCDTHISTSHIQKLTIVTAR